MAGKKKKAKKAQVDEKAAGKLSNKVKPTRKKLVATAEERRAKKLEMRRLEKKAITAEMWAAPAPSNLVGKLQVPKINPRYKTYFEIADNHEKKKKRLEFTVTNDPKPPPGFAFVPIGDPDVTNKCKELSRERDAMIFVVSDHKEKTRLSEHVYRTGYHFRESIVEEVRQVLGETVISAALVPPGFIEPIPEDQEEINKQADKALRDLFPRIPNTDRQMIIDHAFRKGAMFAGEPTVGLQATIPLSRRVQLAALAHIRHTHTRYDQLLRETSWMNARKVVEPVCLDVLLKWRGDEETGRDQMDEILREVVVITDSEDDEDSSDEDETSEDEGEVTSSSSSGSVRSSASRDASPAHASHLLVRELPGGNQRSIQQNSLPRSLPGITEDQEATRRDKRAQKGFHRYRNALADAINRRNNQDPVNHDPDQRAATNPPSGHYISGQPAYQIQPVATSSYTLVPPRNPRRPTTVDDIGYRSSHGHHPLTSRSASSNYRSDVNVNHLNATAYPRDPLPRSADPSRPPQVVREHGLQDLLVPSIEAAPNSFPSLRSVEHTGSFSLRESSTHARPIFGGRRSPPRRQVIIIDDDSPQAKRPRYDNGHDAGQTLRHETQYAAQVPAARFETSARNISSFLNPSSLRKDVPHQSHQMSQPHQSGWGGPGDRLPVYDAPASGTFSQHPRQLGISEVEYRAASRPEILDDSRGYDATVHHRSGNMQTAQSQDRNMNYAPRPSEDQRYFNHPQPYREEAQRISSPQHLNPYGDSGSHSADSRIGVVDHNFVQSFSRSRLEGLPIQRSDGVIILSENSNPSHVEPATYVQRYDNRHSQNHHGGHNDRLLKYGPDANESRSAPREDTRNSQYYQTSQPAHQPAYIVLD